MFFWIKILGVEDTWDMIMQKAIERNIMLVPGKAFCPDPNTKSPYLRAAFSNVEMSKIDGAFEKLVQIIKDETRKT